MSDLFDFSALKMLQKKQSARHVRRASGTIQNSIKHAIVHTSSPNATLHHMVTAECPHPDDARANTGESYLVAYISIPIGWLKAIDHDLAATWDISFVGPAGMIQKLPPALLDMEDLLDERVYIGFDWFWIIGDGLSVPRAQSPKVESIKRRLIEFVTTVRQRVDPEWHPQEGESE